MIFPATWWLENARMTLQSVWFGLFNLALWLSLWALWRGQLGAQSRSARLLWGVSMMLLVAMWLGGATLEMMRRAALVSGLQMMVAIAAFSLLTAGTLSLTREWFGATWNAPLRADKIALSLGVLTLAGWWFGGLALERNALWFLIVDAPSAARAPDAWALLLGGATLLGAARGVKPSPRNQFRVANPRLATWWLFATTLFLSFGTQNPASASVLLGASSVFCLKIWRARHDCPRFLRIAPLGRVLAVVSLTILPCALSPEWRAATPKMWFSTPLQAWREWHQLAAWASLFLALILLLAPLRETLRLAIFDRFFDRALLHGALLGWALATLFFGPGGAVFWAFWPLCGVFFDLLAPREQHQKQRGENPRSSRLAAELPADELAAISAAP